MGAIAAGRGVLIVAVMLSTIVYTLDSTIANVALPHMQGSLQASREQIAWVLTSYIVVSAIVTPLAGFLGQRLGERRMLLVCVGGFTLGSALCGLAGTLQEMVACRMLQGAFGAGLVPLSQTLLLSVYPRERHGAANALWGMGVMVGPILGPTLGGWLTEEYGWRWVFLINLPIGALALAGIAAAAYTPSEAGVRRFDTRGYVFLALAVGLFQLFVDRGHGEDWFASQEIQLEAFCSALFLYLFIAHSLTTRHPFFDPALFRDRSFVVGLLLMFAVGMILLSSMALMPAFLEQLQGYPVSTVGWLLAPRGVGTMASMFLVGRMVHRVDPRLLTGMGLPILALSFWQMRGFGLEVSAHEVVVSGLVQGFGLGFTFVPITTVAFWSLTPRQRTEASALYSLVRNLGSSVGISLVVTLLARDSQVNQARLVEYLSVLDVDKWRVAEQAAGSYAPAVLAAEVQRQASSIAYSNDFAMMACVTLAVMPLLLLLRHPSRRAGTPDVVAPAE